MISTPIPSAKRCANAWSTPSDPPARPIIAAPKAVSNIQVCRRCPA
jgi:hypothetical protein